MLKKILSLLVVVAIVYIAFIWFNNYIYEEKQGDGLTTEDTSTLQVTPISHASLILSWHGATIYVDPVGSPDLYKDQADPDFILITDIHGDHLSVDTLEEIVGPETVLIVPQAVIELLPAVPGKTSEPLASRAVVLANGESAPQLDFTVTAVPMYNIPESEDTFHTKGRGNGYIIENGDTRVYIAGDTSATPEMRALQDIDVAFIPMNLPYTMSIEEAADGVLEFKPKEVYPYHYRGQDGLADTESFKQIVNDGDPNIKVILLNWYPEI